MEKFYIEMLEGDMKPIRRMEFTELVFSMVPAIDLRKDDERVPFNTLISKWKIYELIKPGYRLMQ